MIFLSQVTKIKSNSTQFPFSVPTIKSLNSISFSSPITYLIGENGTGKSTFLESLAIAINSHTIGENPLDKDKTLLNTKILAENLKLSWKLRTHKGFFIRSEDVFGFTKYLHKSQTNLQVTANDFKKNLSGYGQKLAVAAALGQKKSFENRYGENLDANSHGETFLKVFSSRFVPGGLYLIDEPESPLSFSSQLSLLLMLRNMVAQNSQFIIATHSPVLTALPEAQILSFNDHKIEPIKYKDIASFQLVKDFLNNPDAFITRLQS